VPPFDSMESDDNNVSMVGRISDDLATFSLLPVSRWKNLLNLDVIRVSAISVSSMTNIAIEK